MDTPAVARGNFVTPLVSLGLSLSLAGAALLLLGQWAATASAASIPAAPGEPSVEHFNVDNTGDLPDPDLTDHDCIVATSDPLHQCTPRAALEQLNHDGSGSINLPAATYPLTHDVRGDLQITQDIQIYGSGPFLSIIQGNPNGCKNGQGLTLNNDQRGYLRAFDGDGNGSARCDIGAFELQWAARLFLPTLVR